MSWWLRASGIRATLLSTALTFLAAWFVGQSEIPMPDFTGKAGVFLAVHLLGVVPVVFLMHGLTNRDLRMEISAARSWHVRAIAVACGMVATWWCISAVIVVTTHEHHVIALARNATGFLALAVLARAACGVHVALAAMACVPLLCAAAGWGVGGEPQPWAWPLHESASPIALTAAFLLFLAALPLLGLDGRLRR